MTTATIIVTAHREGALAQRTLHAVALAREAARTGGIETEVVVCLDRPDGLTATVVAESPWLEKGDQVLTVDVGDLGLARNAARDRARGRSIGFLDADDYISPDWIAKCIGHPELPRQSILHPEWIVQFGSATHVYRQLAHGDGNFDQDVLLAMNPWNSCSFALAEVYRATPYAEARPGELGFGFEDWHWNCETVAKGHRHVTVHGTVHFVRRKATGSLNAAHFREGAVIPPSALFSR